MKDLIKKYRDRIREIQKNESDLISLINTNNLDINNSHIESIVFFKSENEPLITKARFLREEKKILYSVIRDLENYI